MTGAFEQRREQHAIAEFSASMQFQGQVSGGLFEQVRARLAEVAARLELKAPMPIQFFQLGINPEQPDAGPPVYGYQRFAPDGEVAASLLCDRNSIVFAVREYSRWSELKPTLIETFDELASVYMSELRYGHSLRIQYTNEFRAKSPETKSARELFRPGTGWLAPDVLTRDELWHCHVGEFRTVSPSLRYLINVDSDVTAAQFVGDELASLSVKVMLLCGCFYDVPGGERRDLTSLDLREMLADDLNAAHKLERDTLKEVLSDEYLSLMGADKDDY